MLSCKISPIAIAAIAIPRIKGSFTCGQLPFFVVLTIALTMGAPAKITDIITRFRWHIGGRWHFTKCIVKHRWRAPIAPKVPAISDHCHLVTRVGRECPESDIATFKFNTPIFKTHGHGRPSVTGLLYPHYHSRSHHCR